MTATSRRRDVATSPSHDVGSTNAEVNNSTTSRRHNVATSPRRDVSSKICISSLNARRLRKIRASGSMRREAQNFRAEQHSLQGTSWNLYRFSFFDIFGSHDDVFRTIHFVSFFHDVLNLFLGLYQTLSQTMDKGLIFHVIQLLLICHIYSIPAFQLYDNIWPMLAYSHWRSEIREMR